MTNDSTYWVQTGFCEDTQLPIYEGKGDGEYQTEGYMGEGVYIGEERLRSYYDEDGTYYHIKERYLTRNDPPEPRPKSTVKVTIRKAEPEFNPFAEVRDLDMDLTPYTDNYWGESHYVTDEGDEEQ